MVRNDIPYHSVTKCITLLPPLVLPVSHLQFHAKCPEAMIMSSMQQKNSFVSLSEFLRRVFSVFTCLPCQDMENCTCSISACGVDFIIIIIIIITVYTKQQSARPTLWSPFPDVCKNAWMNSTLKAIPNKWFYRSVVLPHNYLRGVALWIVLMDLGRACGLVLTDDNMIV